MVTYRIALRRTGVLTAFALAAACSPGQAPPESSTDLVPTVPTGEPRPEIYAEMPLHADLSQLSNAQRQMIGLLIEAAQVMDGLFWRQAYGDDYEAWLDSLGAGPARRFAEQNYGPWDRLAN